MSSVSLAAPAKINIYLEILGRDSNGYHLLETVFQTLELADELTVAFVDRTSDHPRVSCRCDDPDLPLDADNLAVRAALAFLRARPDCPAIHIDLSKRIPAGGGLGGGSSDAAAVLRACNRLHPHPLPAEALQTLARELGADVCFFLTGGRAHALGRGDEITPLPDGPTTPCWLILPPFACSTPSVFAALTDDERGPRDALGPEHDWTAQAWHNRLTSACQRSHPRLQTVIDGLADRPWLLCGSGSSLLCLQAVDQERFPSGTRVLATAFRSRSRLDSR